jgi:hypothetical protein
MTDHVSLHVLLVQSRLTFSRSHINETCSKTSKMSLGGVMIKVRYESTKGSQQTKGPCQQHGPFCLLISLLQDSKRGFRRPNRKEERYKMCRGRNPKGRLRREKQDVSTVVTESCPRSQKIQGLGGFSQPFLHFGTGVLCSFFSKKLILGKFQISYENCTPKKYNS